MILCLIVSRVRHPPSQLEDCSEAHERTPHTYARIPVITMSWVAPLLNCTGHLVGYQQALPWQ